MPDQGDIERRLRELAARRAQAEQRMRDEIAEVERAQRAEIERITARQEEAVARARAQLATAAARAERANTEVRARRLDVLRHRRVDDPGAVLARLEREADAEAERDRPLIEQQLAVERQRIRAALDLRLRPLQALPRTAERDQEIEVARAEATAEERVAELRARLELDRRRRELLETKLLIG